MIVRLPIYRNPVSVALAEREKEREGEREREREREREINGKEQRTQYAQMIFLTKVKRNSIGEGKPFNKQS